eukprot:gb/GECG01012190.1/.p1 GENE.gb/GECG01012190.1/~~gb/GECG01012190.1/.p1  ORF type:complete len:134 (+),score=26.16 gb/GECG01012190.1/:1-402(+)
MINHGLVFRYVGLRSVSFVTRMLDAAQLQDQYLQFGIAVVAEHVILGLKFLVEELIPDVPHNVTIQRRRQEYLVDKHLLDSKEADEVAALNGHLKNDDVDPEDAEIAITEAEIGETISEAVSSLQKEKQGDDA